MAAQGIKNYQKASKGIKRHQKTSKGPCSQKFTAEVTLTYLVPIASVMYAHLEWQWQVLDLHPPEIWAHIPSPDILEQSK